VKSLEGMYLRQPIPKTIKTSDPVVNDFYKKTLSNDGIVDPIPMEELEKSMINLSTGSEIDFEEFKRVHRGYIINTNHITNVKRGLDSQLTLTNGHVVPVSNNIKGDLFTFLGIKE
nr:LytTR family DNA-binding domain-containing protein [Saccharofermentans sp.]